VAGAFDRLHPRLRHAIVHDLGWRELRPVQEMTIDAVLDGANAVVLAPTAGGKTEAAIFPLLSQILTEQRAPVAALYVCPIKALLNNQEERLGQYGRMVGLDVFKWHGDVSASVKDRFRREPAHLLMTTPESVEVMLVSSKTDARALFRGLNTIIIDEVHAFAADDRGAHLVSLLERLTAFCGNDIQRIGLSATVGNPHVIGRWLQGSSQRPFRLVDPPRQRAARDLSIDFAEDIVEAARGIAQLARGKKSLVFVESRSRAEKVAQALGGSDVEVFIHHSSVSRADRALAEERFARGSNTAIVATSTMELGIDVGDLDQVLQVDAPASVASFLQRMGRTGRRSGTRANCTFFCTTQDSLLQATALLRLAEAGWVEDVVPAEGAMHVLAHQILALTLQEGGGISRHRVLPWLAEAWPFASIREPRLHQLVDTMVERDILAEADGVLTLGQRGERLYGRKNFFELYAVFSSPPMLRVQNGRDEVGYVSAWFVQGHDGKDGPLLFRLGGRAWQALRIDWNKGTLDVRPADRGQVPSWLGGAGVLSYPLSQAMMDVLIEPGPERDWLTPVAQRTLDELRSGYDGLLEEGTAPLEDHGEHVQWHTFAGGGVNRLLAAGLELLTGDKWVVGNLTLKSKAPGVAKVRDAVRRLRELDWESIATARAHELARGRISKFQPCLPPEAEDRLLAERLLDVPGTLRFLSTVRVGGERIGGTSGHRVDISAEMEWVHVPLVPGRVPTYQPRLPLLYVEDDAALAAICADLAREPVVALDVETTLDTHSLCLVQLATAKRVVIIDPLAVRSIEPLRPLLEGRSTLKVIHYSAFERGVFAGLGIQLENVFDTCAVSKAVRGKDALGGHKLPSVCERELGVTIDKTEQTSSWARRPLSREQLAYAATDVEVLIALHAKLAKLVPQMSLEANREVEP
jgi:ATP-dependent Lhr-like helicase